jgi:hypothetical protein
MANVVLSRTCLHLHDGDLVGTPWYKGERLDGTGRLHLYVIIHTHCNCYDPVTLLCITHRHVFIFVSPRVGAALSVRTHQLAVVALGGVLKRFVGCARSG